MLPGFPKQVTKEKIARGHYRLTRDDGYTVEVRQGVGGWWVSPVGRKVKSLGIIEYDMRNGYTSHDQATPEASGQRAWETAMGIRGYVGSPAWLEDRNGK